MKINYKFYVQWIATVGVFTLLMQIGISIGWASPNLPRLTSPNSSIPLSPVEASWVASLGGLGGVIGAVIGSFIIELFGSKKTILITLIIFAASWTCLIIANSVEWLYISRFLSGTTCGLGYICFSIYLGEVVSCGIRGAVISAAAAGNPFGVAIGTIAESYLPMKVCSSIYLVQSLLAIMLFLWLMDSPYYLMKTNKPELAKESIIFYNTSIDDADKELEEVRKFVEVDAGQNLHTKLQMFKSPSLRKSIVLIIVLFILPHLSGSLVILSYMETILINGKSNLINPQECVIYANIMSIISTFVIVRLVDKLGRRILLMASGIGTAISMAGLGMHFYLLQSGYDSEKLQALPIIFILMYLVTYSIGFTSVPSTVLSEIFPENAKSVAACVAALSASLFAFIATKSFQPLVDLIGEAYVFCIHAVLCLLAVPCAIFFMPETKGKTFQEIQNDLVK